MLRNRNHLLWFGFQLLKVTVLIPAPTYERLRSDSGPGSNWWKVTITVPVPAQFSDLKKKFSIKNYFFCKKPCLFYVNWNSFVDQIQNFTLCLWELFWLFYYSSGTAVINYGSSSGRTKLRFWFWQKSYGSYSFGYATQLKVTRFVSWQIQIKKNLIPDQGFK